MMAGDKIKPSKNQALYMMGAVNPWEEINTCPEEGSIGIEFST
jgi:hypothetical protein